MVEQFQALVAREGGDGYRVELERLSVGDLPADGEVLVDVAFSSLNYKDALAVTARGKIVRRFPMVLGIDLTGTVVESRSDGFRAGDRVVGVAQGLGETSWGGYTQLERVSANAIVPLPHDLTFEQAMQLGTAGFTAMLSVLALERAGVAPGDREVVVTGAAGGVGSVAVLLLAHRGYKVAASTGRPEAEQYLRDLGAASVVPRQELGSQTGPLQSERWAGGVDTVGGSILATVLAQTVYGGAVAACGMAGGSELKTMVWPFILRNVSLLGVSSMRTSKDKRIEAWTTLAEEIDRQKLSAMSRTEPLSKVFELSEEILAGRIRGRTVIDVNAES